MKVCDMVTGRAARRTAALFALTIPWLLVTSVPALAAEIQQNVQGKGEKVGEIKIKTHVAGTGDEGLVGGFNVTKQQGGKTMTLAELEKWLGQDHLNWFQKVTRDTDPPKVGGKPIKPPYIDPPKGGYDSQWADDAPWYWDENRPPPGNTKPWNENLLLEKQTGPSELKYSDFPGGSVGTEVDFATFLISDFGGKKYQVMGGFEWKMKVQANGKTKITSLTKDAKWKKEYADEIKNEFGWVPEPATILLLVVGLMGAARRRAA